MIGGLLGEVLFQALLFFIILRLIAKHEADYDFGKLAMLSAVITLCTTVLTLIAADKGLIYIPIGYLAAFVAATWLLVTFCWVPVWKAAVAVAIVIPAKVGLRILVMILLGKAIGSAPPAEETPASAEAPTALLEKTVPAPSSDALRLREIHAWFRWQMPIAEPLATVKKICDSQTPPVEITGITGMVVSGADGDVPLRSARLKITGRAGTPETAAAVLKTFSGSSPFMDSGGKVFMKRMERDPVDAQHVIFTMECTYPPKFLLARVPEGLAGEFAASEALILPAEQPGVAASNQIASVAAAAEFEVTRLQEVGPVAVPDSVRLLGLYCTTIAGHGSWNSALGTLRGLEQNRGLQIEKFVIQPFTDGSNWEMSVRTEQAAWKED